MASSSSLFFLKRLLTYILLILAATSCLLGCYTSIFSFGDSLADTGNSVILSPPDHQCLCAFSPYGKTYFHGPTGRCSDGRLVIDFMAEYLGLPLVPPYFGGVNYGSSFREGVNFAVVSATALDCEFFEERGINTPTNVSLGVQLDLFKKMLPSLCSTTSDCTKLLQKSLILMGEIGGNDYNHPFFQGISLEEVLKLVPLVVDSIASTIIELIELGALTILVPGNFPIGCLPAYLTYFETSNPEDYDPLTGCINWLNKFSQYHNGMLQMELNHIRQLHPHANIIYADYYNAAMQLYQSPTHFGLNREVLRACCGGGGPYNYNSSITCGNPLASSCYDPSTFVSWDGVHFTEATYRLIFEAIIEGLYTNIPLIDALCTSLAVK